MSESKPTYEKLAALAEVQAAQIEQLQRRIAELEEQLPAAHRQLGPFRRRDTLKKPEAEKMRPGRQEGHEAQRHGG